ncbi:MAG TPA: dicarboxylate/amino acid:cation symporter [Saprospiraceae bacterium]|nr:dicarboxylate/amino acid:cation symporter [Saprospiraceae bacterium]
MKKIALHWQIILGMVLGVLIGLMAIQFSWGKDFVIDWIKPFGTIFIRLLKLLAIPLIISSLLVGISGLKDITNLSRMGLRTIGIYIATTVVAISLGLLLVNTIQPGNFIEESTKEEFSAAFGGAAAEKIELAGSAKDQSPLKPLVDIIPDNIFSAASENGNMLQVIFFVIFFGIGIILIPQEKSEGVRNFFDAFNEVILKMIDLIMLFAPYGVLALMAALVAESPSVDVFQALGMYSLSVLIGLAIMAYLIYPSIVKFIVGYSPVEFIKNIAPAQLVAFSTSSSAATLPVTMERVEEHLGVDQEVTSFVCPVGATINMDGTSLYQAVAAVFIAQAFGYSLSFGDQLTIVLTATLASIGSAAVPGAGILMLIIVLESIGVNPAGIALIFAVDRPLDMCRTMINVTGDAAVSMTVAKSLGKLHDPLVKNWDDYYKKEESGS